MAVSRAHAHRALATYATTRLFGDGQAVELFHVVVSEDYPKWVIRTCGTAIQGSTDQDQGSGALG